MGYFDFLRKSKNAPAEDEAKSVNVVTGKVSPVAGIEEVDLPESSDLVVLFVAAEDAGVDFVSVPLVVVCVAPEVAGVSGCEGTGAGLGSEGFGWSGVVGASGSEGVVWGTPQ